MATSTPYGSGRFKINVNRVKSKKWKDADKVDYGGGWGDDDSDDGYDEPAPVSADNPRHPAWNVPPNVYPSNRSATNPSPSRGGHRPSFDQGDEHRHFASAGNFDSPYPTTQRSPFPEVEPEHDPNLQGYAIHPALRLNTQDQGPMPPGPFRPGSRGRQYPPYEDGPMSAPGAFPYQRRSDSSNRPSGDMYAQHESPMRPESRSSQASYRQFPPRKQSLTQPPPSSDFTQGSHSPAPSHTSATATAVSASDDRPPPAFIRPADIYKRMNEEKEKARKSQESSRPSTASEPNKARETSIGARSASSDPKETIVGAQPMADDTESTRRLKPTLDPVPERKSEYGFDNLIQAPNQDKYDRSEEQALDSEPLGVSRHGTNASSIYTDRPDPVSASSLSRNVSMTDDIPGGQSASNDRPSFGLPLISRTSGFGMESSSPTSAPKPALEVSEPLSRAPLQVQSKGESTGEVIEPKSRELRHQPTMGYTSVVHQAFDQSQRNQTPLTHSSTSSTIDRSNSASTAEISPIISRKPDSNYIPAAVPVTQATIPEESSQGDTRPMSATTLKANEARAPQDHQFSPPLGFRQGSRRDVTPPSRDNSPAKKPFGHTGPGHDVRPQHGSFADAEPAAQEQARGRAPSPKDKPLPRAPEADMATSIPVPKVIARSDSPPKGTVRDLAGRLESSSGRSSPTNSSTQVPLPGLAQGRPPPQARFDSFRPAIPGGWQSYTSSAAPATPGISTSGRTGQSPPRPQLSQTRGESTESIPTARAPTSMAPREPGYSHMAFAAAASAGSALAGAFAGHEMEQDDHESSHQASEEESENEWDRSSSSSDEIAEPPLPQVQPEDQAAGGSAQPLHMTPLAASIPLPIGTPDQPQSVAASTPMSVDSSEADVPHSTLDYFPAPLRTSRSIEASRIRPPIPNITTSQQTPPESENERLQQEIVKSLTPKSSKLDEEFPQQGDSPRMTPAVSAYQAVTNSGPGPHRPISPPSIQAVPIRDDPRITSSSNANPVADAVITSSGQPPSWSTTSRPVEDSIQNGHTKAISPLNGQNASIPPQPFSAAASSPGSDLKLDATLAGAAQSQQSRGQEVQGSGKPFLKQRFSWETGSSPPASVITPKLTNSNSPQTGSPDTIKAPYQPRPSSPEGITPTIANTQPVSRQATLPAPLPALPMQSSVNSSPQVPAPTSHPSASASALPRQLDSSPQASKFPPLTAHSSLTPQSPSGEPAAFRTILSLGSPVERIKAFEDSRQFYAAPNDQLQSWLMSMKTPDNSELFATNGRPSLDTSENLMSHKPSPRRILTNPAGAKQMQEDGKKLMAAAGRFGGKAGTAAKGLFAKGKDRMRNASSGEKGKPTGRRKSSGPLLEEPEDVPAPSQARNSTYLTAGPPQIPLNITPASPLATPTEWFTNRELGGSQTSDLDITRQQKETTSSKPAADQAHPALKARPEQERVTPPGSVVAADIPVTAPSPAISALESEPADHEDVGVPSRSISQLTKPTDDSSVASPHLANVEASQSQKEGPDAHPALVAKSNEAPAATLAPPPAFTDRHDGSTSDAESSDRSLRVPQARPRSIISDVSSASPGPGPDAETHNLRRSVSLSPADERPVASISGVRGEQPVTTDRLVTSNNEAPKIDQVVPPETASAAPVSHQQQPANSESLPAPQQHTIVEPLAHDQVTEQAPARREPPSEQRDAGQYRPFSFVGIEGMGAPHHAQPVQDQDLNRIPSQPMSPISRSSVALSKEMSQVSVDEVPEQAHAPGQRQSRSYSRPFGVDPNVRNHPALRTGEAEQLPLDRAQMYSSESPLPSAKRPQDDVPPVSQRREQQQPPMPQPPRPYEQGYRIPGPYVQEYRSPRQISSPKNGRSAAQVQASGNPLPSTIRPQSYAGQSSPQPQSGRNSYLGEQSNGPGYQEQMPYSNNANAYAEYDMKPEEYERYSQNRPVQQQRNSSGPQPVLARYQSPTHPAAAQAVPTQPQTPSPQAERKKSTFGKLFGGSSSKASKPQKDRASTPVENGGHQTRGKRGSFLRRNESVSSKQSSKYSGRDQLGQLPSSNALQHSSRRHSRDALRASTPDSGDRPTEAKKKRFSGLGGKLFKSGSTARAATAPIPPTNGVGSEQQRTGQRVISENLRDSQRVIYQHQRDGQRVLISEPQSAQNPRMMSPDPYSAQTPSARYPAGPGSYFNQGQVHSPDPQSGYPQSPPLAQAGQYPNSVSPYQHQQQSSGYAYPPQSQPQNLQPPAGLHGPGVYMNPNQSRPSDLRIDTSNQNRGQYNTPATAPAQVRAPSSTSFAPAPYNPNPSPNATTTTTTTGPVSPPARTAQLVTKPQPQAHVIDLHKRSRSPRLGRNASDDLDANEPNVLLGTFSNKNISPVGGVRRSDNDQERPFAVTLPPGFDDHESSRHGKHNVRERVSAGTARNDTPVSVGSSSGRGSGSNARSTTSPSSQAKSAGYLDRNVSVLQGYNDMPASPREARRSSARDKTTPAGVIAELPGSKAEGYESEEEIPMSATAYPGQEWMPVFVGDGRWDD